ncbi:MAG TPA: ABC transporter permease [Acidimicrobiales bacterium]|nr:ABC transporter permease [Acidimicrobiales bacterium]
MARYIGIRLGQLVFISFLISLTAFLLVHLLPGDPTTTILGPYDTPSARAELLKQLGLNKPLYHQYWTWIVNVLHGQLGEAFTTKQTVSNILAVALPIDIELMIVSSIIALVVAIPLALVSALRPNRLFDRSSTTSTLGMLALPPFVAGPLLVLIFAVSLHWVPATGFDRLSAGIGPNLKSVILPSIVLSFGSIAVYFRLLRADLISTLQEDFVTMARSKGLSTPYILFRHVLRPSSFSLLAAAGLSIGSLFSGAFVVEVLFQMPGVGYQLVNHIYARDYLVVQGLALVAAVAFVVINFVADFLLTVLDPRVRRA